MWVDGGGSGSCNCGEVRLGGGLLVLGHFLAKLAFGWLVDSPRHVVDTPVEGKFTMFLGLRFAVLGRDLLPSLSSFCLRLFNVSFLFFVARLLLPSLPSLPPPAI
jgi:hypothetical protein